MNSNMRSKIVEILETLDGDGVEVTTSNLEKTINIRYRTERSLDFKFIWSKDHFFGVFMDKDGNKSHAVIAIWDDEEAYEFALAYRTLISLRAGRR